MATYKYFSVGDYEYTNNTYKATRRGGHDVGVRVKKAIRSSVTALSNIPATVEYGGVTYYVRELYALFPPDSQDVEYGDWTPTSYSPYGCFQNCWALETVPEFPSTIDWEVVSYLYASCRSLTQVPALPEGVVRMSGLCNGCISLQTAPNIPSTATNIYSFLYLCYAIQTAPEIPTAVADMGSAFLRCINLEGNVTVNNMPTDYGSLFNYTTKDIYIINGGTAGSVWKDTIAPAYSNVHYEDDDHPAPSLSSFTARRVASNGSTTTAEKGLWAYLRAQVNISEQYLPDGWTATYDGTSLDLDGTSITPTWTVSAQSGNITLTAWVNVGNLSAHTFELLVYEAVKEGTTVINRQSTFSQTVNLPKAYALVDYYHDPTTGTEGFAVGKYAEEANLFDCAMPAVFERELEADSDVYIGLSGYQSTGSIDKVLYDAIIALGWNDVLIDIGPA